MTPAGKISLKTKKIFHELDFLAEDPELTKSVRDCVEAQKTACSNKLSQIFKPCPEAVREVSPEALEQILASGKAVNGIRTEREISNVLVFNDPRYEFAVLSDEISETRKKLDQLVREKVRELFTEGERFDVQSSGFFLYPPQGFMGWHTNWKNPGWRLYINYTEEPGKSFFRYRDTDTRQVITSVDKRLNFRLFRASKKNPFWHTIYSETYRYSLGYKIIEPPGLLSRLRRALSLRAGF